MRQKIKGFSREEYDKYELGIACTNYDSTMSVGDCLLETRIVKITRKGLHWYIDASMQKKILKFLEDFHVETKVSLLLNQSYRDMNRKSLFMYLHFENVMV